MRANRHAWSASAAEAADLGEFRHGHRLSSAVPERVIPWIVVLLVVAVPFLALGAQ